MNPVQAIEQVERLATDVVARVAPWAAPVPTAYLVGRASVLHLGWPDWVGLTAALVVECLGLVTTATALELREYNAAKRKNDPAAPFVLATALVGVYLVVAVGLTVALDIAPALATYAPAIFPVLSLTGVTVLALRGDHRRRLAGIEHVKQERKAERRRSAQQAPNECTPVPKSDAQNDALVIHPGGRSSAQFRAPDAQLDAANRTRQAHKRALKKALLDAYRDNPHLGATVAAQLLGVHRNTVYTYAAELESAGVIRRNGDGVEVL